MSAQPADIFISHASEDKEEIARPLAEALRQRGLIVWYDDYILRLGDSLRAVIDKGLNSSRFGVVILSAAFFSKEWPQRELNGLFARETAHGVKVLLPVWHRVTAEEVARFSPLLADRLAVSTARGLEVVVQQILEVIEPGRPAPKPEPKSPPVVSLRREPSLPVEGRSKTSPAVPKRAAEKPSVEAMPALPQSPPLGSLSQPRAQTSGGNKAQSSFRDSRTQRSSPKHAKAPAAASRRLPLRTLALIIALILLVTISGIWASGRWRAFSVSTEPEVTVTSEVPSTSGQQSTPSDQELVTLRDFAARQHIGIRLLSNVAEALPELLWLDRLVFSADGVSIKGRAFNTNAIANFIENLDKLPDFSEPTLKEVSEEAGGVYKFVLTFDRERPTEPTRQSSSSSLWETERDNLLGRLTPQVQRDGILRQIRALTEESSLQIKKFLPGASLEAGTHIETAPLALQVDAVSSHELAAFLDQISQFSPLVTLREIVVTVDGQRIAADLSFELPILKVGVALPPGGVEQVGVEKRPEEKLPKFRREPFGSLLLEPERLSEMRGPRPEGIPGLFIDELDLIGIWRTSRGFVAQVTADNGVRKYLLKNGDQLYDGDVVSISKNEIVFKQIVQDPAALKPFREVVKSLSPS